MGDPTRRPVLELLRDGERAVGALAAELPVSRPAVSQHLRVLKGAGLVIERRDGTRHLYRVDPDGLAAIRTYLERTGTTCSPPSRRRPSRRTSGPMIDPISVAVT